MLAPVGLSIRLNPHRLPPLPGAAWLDQLDGGPDTLLRWLETQRLVRHHSVRTEQADGHGEIWVLPGEVFNAALDLSNVATYGEKAAAGESPELAKAA